jgi:redox-sensing transcriptional repressor
MSRRASPSRPASAGNHHGIPDATVARLPVYLRVLYALADRGVATVSSEELAAAAGVNSAKLRKDLSHLGSYGTRGVGYDVEYLVYQVSRELGLTQDWPVLIVGAGNLGRALANYGGFASRGFRIAALLDADPAVVGTVIARHTVRSADEIEEAVRLFDVAIGVIATPAAAAQNVCNRLVAAGVTSILNFAPVVLSVPSGVDVRKVDLSIELQILAFHAQRRTAAAPPAGVRPSRSAVSGVGAASGGAVIAERGQDAELAGGLLEGTSGGELRVDSAAARSRRLAASNGRGRVAGGTGRVNDDGRVKGVSGRGRGGAKAPGGASEHDYSTGAQAVGT